MSVIYERELSEGMNLFGVLVKVDARDEQEARELVAAAIYGSVSADGEPLKVIGPTYSWDERGIFQI